MLKLLQNIACICIIIFKNGRMYINMTYIRILLYYVIILLYNYKKKN